MICLEMSIPPLPQLVTIGHAVWSPGQKHYARTFDVYDMILVNSGVLYLTEDGVPYEIHGNQLLVLEPGRHHVGHRPCDEPTDVYWVHFIHEPPSRTIDSGSIPWSYPYVKGTDYDLAPHRQMMYLPKLADYQAADIVPILDRMVELHHNPTTSGSLPLQAEFAGLLAQLQSMASSQYAPRSRVLSDLGVAYLQQHMSAPFDSKHMEDTLHYRFDYIARCIKQHTGRSPLQYLHDLRIRAAKSLLAHADLSVAEVGERVGIDNANYFIRLFRKETGITPRQYRSERLGRA